MFLCNAVLAVVALCLSAGFLQADAVFLEMEVRYLPSGETFKIKKIERTDGSQYWTMTTEDETRSYPVHYVSPIDEKRMVYLIPFQRGRRYYFQVLSYEYPHYGLMALFVPILIDHHSAIGYQ